jgi:hypothetical protein
MARFDGASIGPGGVPILPGRRQLDCLEQKFLEPETS